MGRACSVRACWPVDQIVTWCSEGCVLGDVQQWGDLSTSEWRQCVILGTLLKEVLSLIWGVSSLKMILGGWW